jgi:hypothetical protein
MLLFIFVIVRGLFEWKPISAGFFLLLLFVIVICIAVVYPIFKIEEVGIPLIGLTPPHVYGRT